MARSAHERRLTRAALAVALLGILGRNTSAQTLRTDFPIPNGPVDALAVSGSTLYIGGSFSSLQPANGGPVTRLCLAALDLPSGAIKPWNPQADGRVYDIAVSGSTVFVGGLFTTISGQTRECIAALDAATGQVKAFDAGDFDGLHNIEVYSVAANPTTVFVSGSFYWINSQGRDFLAAFDATTGQLRPWNPQSSWEVDELFLDGGTVYIGGRFETMGGQARFGLAAVDTSTGAVTTWNPQSNGQVRALGVHGNSVHAGGGFAMIGGQSRGCIAALDPSTGLANAWNPNANLAVFSIAAAGGAVYASGRFTSIGGQPRNRLAALDPVSGLATPWDPNVNNLVLAIAVGEGTVCAGGEFTQVQGTPRSYLAAWEFAVTDVAGGPETGVRLECAPNPFRTAARIRYRLAQPAVVGLELFDLGGRRVAALIGGSTEPSGWHEVPLDGRGIQAGIYFCRLKAGSDTRVLRVLRID